MLKTRLLTAFILIPLTLFVLFYAPPPIFLFITGLMVLYGAWEWSGLMLLSAKKYRLAYVMLTALLLVAACFLPVHIILWTAFAWWLIASVLVFIYPKGISLWASRKSLRGLMGILVLIPCWMAMNVIRSQEAGAFALLYLLVLIWGADSMAYFVGRLVGRHKLAPSVSPGKTWEGLLGACVAGLLITWFTLWVSHTPPRIWGWCLALALAVTLFSIVGDLFESMIKRQAGVKDSGKLLPGHGGLLDRIDSLTAAAPLFLLGVLCLTRYVSN